ncbi:hypothetical protein [Paraburkholderia caffeinitolerans]|uniref:hypothetical protein n=1 Tax=Paraburkholderia caffeinitolerans TaxID=1723730 RepID=UPI001583B5E1|nr:hypothetical protein [Paraburkholderia caffeinitolerans]
MATEAILARDPLTTGTSEPAAEWDVAWRRARSRAAHLCRSRELLSQTNDDAPRARSVVCLNIEEQVKGADTMIDMYSASSSTVSLTFNVFFEIGSNPEPMEAGAQNRLRVVLPRPSREVRSQGIQVQRKSSAFIAALVPP